MMVLKRTLRFRIIMMITAITRMWAYAQRDGRPPNIGGAFCESSVIPFLEPRRKV